MRNKAIILVILFIFGILITFSLTKHRQSQDISRVGFPAPDIELIDINKNPLKLHELKDSVILINFWASWCEPCVNEMPFIEWLFKHLSENPKFKLITILYKDDKDKAFRYMKENGFTFPLYLDPNESAAKRFGVTGVPETYIFDKRGNLRKRVIGPLAMDFQHAIELFQSLINE